VNGEGAIRIPLPASSFLCNDLAFPRISRKSLGFQSSLFRSPLPLPIFQEIGDRYSKLEEDAEFCEQLADAVGLGFHLPDAASRNEMIRKD
jgi:hypothetical protein